MPRLGYREAECCRCFSAVYLPFPTYRPKDLALFVVVVCRGCREALESLFGGVVVDNVKGVE